MHLTTESILALETLFVQKKNDFKVLLEKICDNICGRVDLQELKAFFPSSKGKYVYALKNLIETILFKSNSDDFSEIDQFDYFLESETNQTVREVLKTRKDELLYALRENITLLGEPILIDFDWAVKITLGSDTICASTAEKKGNEDSMQPICQLQLRVDNNLNNLNSSSNSRGSPHISSLELNGNELDNLIVCLEEALIACENI